MEVIFAREKFVDLIDEALPLLTKHYLEIAWRRDKIELDIDMDAYKVMEDSGRLLCYTARLAGTMVGYASFFYAAAPHYKSTQYAVSDVIFVSPAYRGGTGSKFIDYIEEDLIALGAQVISFHVKKIFNFGPLLARKGFDDADSVWLKWVGD